MEAREGAVPNRQRGLSRRESARDFAGRRKSAKNGRESTTPAAITVGVVVHKMPPMMAAINLAPQSQPSS
jgi:hypothetical protein